MTNPTDERLARVLCSNVCIDCGAGGCDRWRQYLLDAEHIRNDCEAAGLITTPRVEDAEVREAGAWLRRAGTPYDGQVAALIERQAAEKLRLEHLCEGYRLENEELKEDRDAVDRSEGTQAWLSLKGWKAYDPTTHVAVPREPTEAMLESGWGDEYTITNERQREMVLENYRAMLTASEGEGT